MRRIAAGVPSATICPPEETGAGTDVHDPVRGFHRLPIVLDNDQRVADVPKMTERLEQPDVVALMEPDRRLVQDVENSR